MILLYFLVGVLFDFIITLDTQAVIHRQVLRTFMYSFIITVISVTIMTEIVLSSDRMPLLISYALGAGTGSSLAVYFKKGGKDGTQIHEER